MAKKDEDLIKVKALVYLKYDADNFKPGENFGIREENQKEMIERGYIEVLEEFPKEGE